MAMTTTIAVVAQGVMGAGVGKRLADRGARVITSLEGRSAASAKRAKEAGMADVSYEELAKADYFLSILPPVDAPALARRMSAIISASNHKPVYVDCNALSPPTKIEVGEIIAGSGAPFIDAGIIGTAPKEGSTWPHLYCSGPEAERFAPIGDFGLTVRVMKDTPVGAASGMKMNYAGFTKGLSALGSMMILAAHREGITDTLRAEFEVSQPQLFAWLQRQLPAMFSKAYRFNGEMLEIADYVGEDPAARKLFEAASELYTRIAADYDGEKEEVGALAEFVRPKQ
jgi:3-hydroxyisobutyrate dehydrogenase-like beta-hydroxyacid dehydrogenase